MQASKKSAKTKTRDVPKSAKVKLSDLTPKKQPMGGRWNLDPTLKTQQG